MFDLLRCDFQHLSNLSLSAMLQMTDLNIILTLWRLQIEQAEQALQQFSSSKAISALYGERLIQSPLETIQAANQFLDLGISAEQINAIVSSDNLFDDAKTTGERFSLEKRQAVYQKLEDFYGVELDNVQNWMLRNNPKIKLTPALTPALT
jgi:hypothetical protein